MKVIHARNVSWALVRGVQLLSKEGLLSGSRNGQVYRNDGPVTTVYGRPLERVVFWPERDANPFLHFFESLWMLAGSRDVAFPARFAANMTKYSDDGKVLHGAYGFRWRTRFGKDQLDLVVNELMHGPDSRRAVLQMWDAVIDLGRDGRDVPCNTHIYFRINENWKDPYEGPLDTDHMKTPALEMTVCCRSNDIVWGAYGANAVHFSYLHEYMAARLGVGVGRYWQVSNDYHAYLEAYEGLLPLAFVTEDAVSPATDRYGQGLVGAFPLVSNGTIWKEWEQDLQMFVHEGPIVGFRDRFFRRVATPLWHAHAAYSNKADPARYQKAIDILHQCLAVDWRTAAIEWVQRREKKALEKSRG